jgi:LPS O-antigen subunit length determinant protein (WzzB/FepE family)
MYSSEPKNFIEISFAQIFSILYARKYIVISFSLIAFIISLVYSLNVTKIYTSTAILVEADKEELSQSNNSSIGGGFASLVGLSGGGSLSKNRESILIIQSRNFFQEFYEDDLFIANLLEANKYNSGSIIYKPSFDGVDKKWLSEKPSFEKAYKQFRMVVRISEDMLDKSVSISVRHMSPMVAKDWNERIINAVNLYQKEYSKIRAQIKLDYYLATSNSNSDINIKNHLNALINRELISLALSNTNDEYAFRVIDPPHLPERASDPSRTIIVLLGTFLGFIFSCLLALIFNFYKLRKLDL